ncbi:MAG: hypothetical protein JWM68_5254 [Verrucomicrobiales bacterium]|nr:hypothetical protein [Verrucomicrobiales bacterium]
MFFRHELHRLTRISKQQRRHAPWLFAVRLKIRVNLCNSCLTPFRNYFLLKIRVILPFRFYNDP